MGHIAPIPKQVQRPQQESASNQKPINTNQSRQIAILALILAFVAPLIGLILTLAIRKNYPEGSNEYKLIRAALIISIVLTAVSFLLLLIGSIAYFNVLKPTHFTSPTI